jgi:hypothetical protein
MFVRIQGTRQTALQRIGNVKSECTLLVEYSVREAEFSIGDLIVRKVGMD